ncbi:MAG: secondary thiamine-phosphate synthase enzyme YjbQ [Myxococcales bacterium]|jgi:secondary thiamine-phosphate synthase enzyme
MSTITTQSFHVDTRGRGTYEITAEVQRRVREAGVEQGLCTVFVHHTSASLFINENADPAVRRDLDAFLERLVPDGDPIYSHVDEGPDDMSSHVKNVLTQTSLGIPIAGGRCDLGTWQGVYLWEHRRAPHQRRVSVTLVGG